MRLDVGLVHHEKSNGAADLVPRVGVWVVRRPHSVEVERLKLQKFEFKLNAWAGGVEVC